MMIARVPLPKKAKKSWSVYTKLQNVSGVMTSKDASGYAFANTVGMVTLLWEFHLNSYVLIIPSSILRKTQTAKFILNLVVATANFISNLAVTTENFRKSSLKYNDKKGFSFEMLNLHPTKEALNAVDYAYSPP